MKNLYSLQNGTDIRGVAYKDENSSLEITLSKENVELIVRGFATWLTDKLKKKNIKISLGRDSRVTGEELLNVGISTLKDLNVDIVNCGLATTPAIFMSTIMDGYDCDGGIMFTASHMPYVYNGMKIFTKDGCLEKSDLKDILDICVSGNFMLSDKSDGKIYMKNLIEDYSNIIVEKIRCDVNSKINYDKPLESIKIVVDAGNGAGGFFADNVLKKLGADTTGSQFLEPDGFFPNHIPNPENKEAMESISKAVLKNNADLGIIFDTDVDRAAIVGNNGEFINKNALIAVISKIILEEHPNSTIVTDSVTSDGLSKFISDNGGIHHRFKRGYKNVINESIRLNDLGVDSQLAIETSGHAALKENYFLDDGAYLVAKILIKAAKLYIDGKKITQLIDKLSEPLDEKEKRIKINVEKYQEYGDMVISELKKFVSTQNHWSEVEKNYEGIRVNCNGEDEKGWFLLRKSLHEPLLVLNVESDLKNGCDSIYKILEIFLSRYELDVTL